MPAAAENGAPRDVPLASLARRLLSLLYEALLLDRERQFLHDRLAGTRIVNC